MIRPSGILSNILSVAAAVATVWAGSALAQVQTPESIVPDPSVREFIDSKKADIEAIVERALDSGVDAESRVKAVSELSGLYFDYLLANAEPLIRDPSADVALATALSLAGHIAMIPTGPAVAHSGQGEYDAYEIGLVRRAEDLLLIAQDHPDPAVSAEATAILTSRGEPRGIAHVPQLIEEGKMSAEEGIGYLSLAPAEVASPIIAEYAAAADPAVQAAAIRQLSYNLDYTELVRETVLRAGAPSEVVIAALPGLAVTDTEEFLTYGLALANDAEQDTVVRSQALESYIRSIGDATEATIRSIAPDLRETARDIAVPQALEAVEGLETIYNKLQSNTE